MSSRKTAKTRTAQHRPAIKRRRFKHDNPIAVDLFSGFGGLTTGIKKAGFDTILAANHNEYKTSVHEANHPEAEHWIADLVDPGSADYHDVRDLPAADFLAAGVSCVNHSPANSQRAYEMRGTLFDTVDEEYEARVTRSERDRATANCVLHYAAEHHPRLMLIECTTQLLSWGPLIPGSKKIGDGTTYRWWLKQFDLLGYDHKVLFLNSMFFGVGQSRNRAYWAFWDRKLPAPDLEHQPETWCDRCQTIVQAVWSWKTGIPPNGTVDYGRQYNYRCPSCRTEVIPPFTPSLDAIDLSNLGTRIGDKPIKTFKDGYVGPLARSTMERAERCRRKFPDFPAIIMPAKAERGTERHLWQPMVTQTSQQEGALLSTGALMAAAGNTFERPGSNCRVRTLADPLTTQTATNGTGLITPGIALAVDNYQGVPRGADEPLPTQVGSETLGIVSTGVVPFRQHTTPTMHSEPMPTMTADQIPGLLSAASEIRGGALFAGWYKQNGSTGDQTAPHPMVDPFGTMTSKDTTALLTAEWAQALSELPLEDCFFRMLSSREIGRGCGFDVEWNGREGTFVVWGSERDRTDGYGNAVSPPVGEWISGRLRAVLHPELAA